MKEIHPYDFFIPLKTRSLIIGSFPIGKFSHPDRAHEIKPHEFRFYFGGETNLLWKLLAATFKTDLSTVDDIKTMLSSRHMGIADLIKSCVRKEGSASDSALFGIEWNNDLEEVIKDHKIQTVFFTSKFVERNYHRLFPDIHINEILLISPSAQTFRSLGKNPAYLEFKKLNPDLKAFDFMLKTYREAFKGY